MTMRDAAVTVRSLPRRFGEILNGPLDDDTWDRLVRTPDAAGRSAAGWTAQTTALITALGTAIAALPMTARPAVELAKLTTGRSEPSRGTAIATVLHELGDVAGRAATAIEGRQPGDFDRKCLVDGAEEAAFDFVNRVVAAAVANLRHAADAVDAARNPK